MVNIVKVKHVTIQQVKVANCQNQETTCLRSTAQLMTPWLAFKIMVNTATIQINTGAKSSMD